MAVWLAALLLCGIGILHSVLGHSSVIRPLVRNTSWDVGIPRWAVDRLLVFAWHLTTLAWFGLAAAVLGASPLLATGIVCLGSGLMIFFALRGHLAWPLFFLASGAALHAERLLPPQSLATLAGLCGLVALAIAVLHAYWALGGRKLQTQAIPSREGGEPLFRPGPGITWVVVGALLSYATLVVWPVLGEPPSWAGWLLALASGVLSLRALGDGKYVGFSKNLRTTKFSRLDDLVYTPIVVLLAFGGLGSLQL